MNVKDANDNKYYYFCSQGQTQLELLSNKAKFELLIEHFCPVLHLDTSEFAPSDEIIV